MLKKLWFQIHWLLGITAGVVLAVVGITGGMLSFEQDLLRALNPGVMTVMPRDALPLAPTELLTRVRTAAPDRRVSALTLSSDRADAAKVTLVPQGRAAAGGRAPRGQTQYVDPYSGALLGQAQGADFLRMVRQVHRWLAADEVGKQIVGGSTMALAVLALSGLYLRWPRRWNDVRTWFTFRFAHKGRSFLWGMHSVVGTWVLLPYLLMAFTGLYWSYDWYRGALYELSGTPRPVAQGEARGIERGARDAQAVAGTDLDATWATFRREAGDFSTATLRLPERAGQGLQIQYLPRDAAHERASNRMSFDAGGALRAHDRYVDKPVGAKFMASIFPLHSGSFFGPIGVVVLMLASFLMPLFAITGWMLYLDRRRAKQALRRARAEAAPRRTAPVAASMNAMQEWLIGFASQTGFAERLAWQTAGVLRAAGVPVRVRPLDRLDQEGLRHVSRALFIVSTFGQGEPPDGARGFVRHLMREGITLDGLRFGLLAIGDRNYRSFCEFGRTLERWLCRHGAQPMFERVELDRRDASTLHDWRSRVDAVSGGTGAWEEEDTFAPWRLAARHHLNPGSAGAASFHLEFEPCAGALPHWQAGDLVEIIPRHSAEEVVAWLAQTPFTGEEIVEIDGRACAFADALRESELSAPPQVRGDVSAQALAATLRRIAPRAFSIASLPQDARVHLLVRQARLADGSPGLASGWLTTTMPLGGETAMRVRTHAGFHLRDSDAPLLLIGNGTGMAGLHSHLKQRIAAGRKRNWLVYGERNAAHDYYYHEEIAAWHARGLLARVDLAFSRDQQSRVYVQEKLRQAAAEISAWVADGASILVCGSLAGMAEGVDAALREILGAETVDALAANGRYRRDVY